MTIECDRIIELADQLEAKAASIRSRVARASAASQHIMRAEAKAYEQSAAAVRNAMKEGA